MKTPADSSPGEVCLLDDDASVLRSMQYLLASDGIAVRAFQKPEEFLEYAATHRVSVVVTDIWMPGITGLEILARTCAITPRPRVIVITARDDLAARATAMAVGPVAFFIKPFNDEQFLAAVHDALAQAKQ
ncbi:MAG TPA: response regulator [Chthoniobacterales bacterium]|nr:response regulator [Chthoniobacterales bacterium]